ncbi:MAG: hypothetical protein DHS20C18_32120 [Saprospiraceae bacterium]|nr:MAG: hypothetical protein DHS20C18_32120 [Saprospiraceae bacterium]
MEIDNEVFKDLNDIHRPIGGGKRGHDDPELVIDYEITDEDGNQVIKQFRGVKQ